MPNEALRNVLRPEWPAPAGVGALMSTRAGGVSAAPWDGCNLGDAVGDDPAAVAENRARFTAAMEAAPVWLRQVHGTRVLRLQAADTQAAPHAPPEADAAVTSERGVACVVQVADCLPVLFAALNGRAVGAAHAGWRGLAGGVLENTLSELCAAARCAPQEVAAWLGPCIGPESFEVGADVLRGFGIDPAAGDPAFVYRPRGDASARWRADLPALARRRLQAAGLRQISGGQWCTVTDASRFFSFRRDGVTGRQAAAVWLR